MKFANISLGNDVEIDSSSSFNNVIIAEKVKIAKNCSLFGSPNYLLEIGAATYIGMNSIINGYADKIVIGNNVSIAQNVNIMADSGPNASSIMQEIFPIQRGPIKIGNHSWIGANSIIMPHVVLGDYCIVAANSFVKNSFNSYSIIGGNPAKLIRTLTEEEINKIKPND